MGSRRFSISISSGLLWTMIAAFSLATFRFSESWTQSVFAGGCCAVVIGLLQQVIWLLGLPSLERHRNTLRLGMVWRICVVIAMAWSFVILAASHYGLVPEALHGGFEEDGNAWFGTQQLAVAGLAVGCLCGVMTAPWLRLNRLASSQMTIRGFLYATIAGIPIALNTAVDCGTITGLVDIAMQGVLVGLQEPVTVSSGALPNELSRGNSLNTLFVAKSIRAWCGVALALIVLSLVSRTSTRPRVRLYGCLLAIALAIPAVLFIHWLSIEGYRRVAPQYWQVHHWPNWYALSLAILPLTAVAVMLSIKRQGIELAAQGSQPKFLSDSYFTLLMFVTTPVLWVWESVRSFLDSEAAAFMGLFSASIPEFVLMTAVGEMASPNGGMLITILAVISLGAIASRWRYAPSSPRSLIELQVWQIPLFVVVLALVVLLVVCTIPFGVAMLHVGI